MLLYIFLEKFMNVLNFNKIMEKNFNVFSVILIIILLIRLIGQVINIFLHFDYFFIFFVIGVLYILALIGVYKKQKWGFGLVMFIGFIDIVFSLIVGGSYGLGSGIIDLFFIILGYKMYEQVSY